jgi:hypothetical protein
MPALAFRFGHETGGVHFTERLAAGAAETKTGGIFGVALRAYHRDFFRAGVDNRFFCWWEGLRVRITPPCLPGRFCDRLEGEQTEGVGRIYIFNRILSILG